MPSGRDGNIGGSEHSATAALETAQRADLQSTLPPVIVICCADGRCAIPLSLPADAAQITWRLELEDGSERRGAPSIPKQREALTSDSFQFCLELIDVPWGYHTLNLPELQAETSLIVSPGRCWLPDCFGKSFGLWGVAAQLPLLRSENNWGIGDFADLRRLVAVSGERGCDVLGLNPLHQMFLDNPDQASPYSPLSRLFLNVLYITVADAPGYANSEALRGRLETEDFHAGLAACRAARHVDYAAVVSLKIEALRILYAAFEEGSVENHQSFEKFRHEHGAGLRLTSVFQVLRQHFAASDRAMADWHAWPHEYRDAGSKAVAAFAREHKSEIEYLEWLQWIADQQLAAVAHDAREAKMAIGLHRDLALGCDCSGAETWASPNAFLRGASVGAPPDVFNPAGQDWGVAPFHPKRSTRKPTAAS